MEYTIISGSDSVEVSREVNEKLAEGWELYGELKVAAYFADYGDDVSPEHVWMYAQTLIKKDESLNAFVHG